MPPASDLAVAACQVAPTKGQATRQRILETAAAEFHRLSFHAVTLDALAEAARVNKASVYQYFKNKEDLAMECLRYYHGMAKEVIFDASFAASEQPIKRLEGIFKRVHQIHEKKIAQHGCTPGCPFVNLANELATQNEPLRSLVAEVFADLARYHTSIFLAARRAGLTALKTSGKRVGAQVQMVLNGAMTNAKVNNRADDILVGLDIAKRTMGLSA